MANSTLRERSCSRKRKYFTDAEAQEARWRAQARCPSLTIRVYRCQFCRGRHLTSTDWTLEQIKQARSAAKRLVARGQ